MPAFPAVAIVLTLGVRRIPAAVEQALLLAFAYYCQALYPYYVLDQSARIFVE
jgi:hypothetical protein